VLTLLLPALLATAPEPVTFFISTAGRDTWSGQLAAPNAAGTDGPFASLERARDAIREARPAGGAVVQIAGGRYDRRQTFTLTAEDSGTADAPIVYRAKPGETVILSGGQAVDTWQPVTDPAVRERLDPAVRDRVRQADLKALGITSFGDMGLDSEAELQLKLARREGQGEYTKGSAYASAGKAVEPRLELFFEGRPMHLSRWPNDGSIKIAEVLGTSEIDVRGTKGCKEGIFVYDGDRPSRWVDEPDGWVNGAWFRDWAEQVSPIASIDPATHTMAVKPPYHDYGYRKGMWFYGVNLLCELDDPGEWYLDRANGRIYFDPPGELKPGAAEVSVCPTLILATDVSHVSFEGLTCETARGSGIVIRNGESCRVARCTLRNLANHGVVIDEGHGCRVDGCDIYGLGGGGIYLVGGDKPTLSPGRHVAENNHVHHYARWDRMYRPAVMVGGVGQRVAHNLIHDAPHAGIIYGGNDHLFEFNEIHSVCYDSNDCGAIYAGRSWTLRGNVFRHNYLHHLYGRPGGPCRGIYLDDLLSGAVVYGNVFWQVTYAVFIGGGRDNLIENNLFVDSPHPLHVDGRALGWSQPHADGRIKEATEKGTIAGIKFNVPPYSERYPKLLTLLDDDPKWPKGNVWQRNIFWAGDKTNLTRYFKGGPVPETWWTHLEAKIAEVVTVRDNLVDTDPKLQDASHGDFRLAPDSPAILMGFKPLPLAQIGLFEDPARATWPVAHTPRPMPAQ